MSYINNFKDFWSEVELRAKSNYEDFSTVEQIKTNIDRAIQEIADELKDSQQAIEVKHSILADMGLED